MVIAAATINRGIVHLDGHVCIDQYSSTYTVYTRVHVLYLSTTRVLQYILQYGHSSMLLQYIYAIWPIDAIILPLGVYSITRVLVVLQYGHIVPYRYSSTYTCTGTRYTCQLSARVPVLQYCIIIACYCKYCTVLVGSIPPRVPVPVHVLQYMHVLVSRCSML